MCVRRFADLRVLELPSRHTCFYKRCACPYKGQAPLDNLLELRHDAELRVWNEGYDANGDWSVELARQTAAQVVAARAASKPKAQPKPTAPKTTAHGKRKRASDVGASAAKRKKTVPVQDTVQTAGAGATTHRVQPLQRQPLMETEEEDEFGGALA